MTTKCKKCNTELFDCDVVKRIIKEKEDYLEPIKLLKTIYRCPKCYTTKVVKE